MPGRVEGRIKGGAEGVVARGLEGAGGEDGAASEACAEGPIAGGAEARVTATAGREATPRDGALPPFLPFDFADEGGGEARWCAPFPETGPFGAAATARAAVPERAVRFMGFQSRGRGALPFWRVLRQCSAGKPARAANCSPQLASGMPKLSVRVRYGVDLGPEGVGREPTISAALPPVASRMPRASKVGSTVTSSRTAVASPTTWGPSRGWSSPQSRPRES
jgi:hypothetical protein